MVCHRSTRPVARDRSGRATPRSVITGQTAATPISASASTARSMPWAGIAWTTWMRRGGSPAAGRVQGMRPETRWRATSSTMIPCSRRPSSTTTTSSPGRTRNAPARWVAASGPRTTFAPLTSSEEMKNRGIRLGWAFVPETHHSVTAADGVRLAVSVSGPADAEPLLLIPGLGAAASVFDPIRPSLESRYRTIVYDPRGVGASESGESALTMNLMVADVAAVLDGVGLNNAHVMGASMGGAVAQYFVLEQPARVARLVLAATAPGGGKAVPADQRATDALLGKGARTPEEAYRMACTVLYSPQFQRTHSDFIEEQIRWRGAHPVRP